MVVLAEIHWQPQSPESWGLKLGATLGAPTQFPWVVAVPAAAVAGVGGTCSAGTSGGQVGGGYRGGSSIGVTGVGAGGRLFPFMSALAVAAAESLRWRGV